MARTKKSRSSHWSMKRIFQYIVVILTGGGAGAGGWHFRDTFIGKAVVRYEQNTPEEDRITTKLKERIEKVIDGDPFTKEGVFEVRLDEIAIDKDVMKPAHAESIRIYVVKQSKDGNKKTVWDSKTAGKVVAHIGEDAITTGWKESPFEVEWSPGDEITLQVWEYRGLRPTHLFTMPAPGRKGDKPSFPLTSGPHPIDLVSRTTSGDPKINEVTFRSKRLGDRSGGGKSAPDDRVANSKAGTISIK